MSRGKGWEAMLRQVHAGYRRRGLAVVDKTDPPIKHLRELGKGKFEACWSGAGPVDYFGCMPGGRMVVFDGKDCKSDRWHLGQLKKHQARCLDNYAKMGALCFVALRAWRSTWVLPWAVLGPLWWAWERKEAKRGAMSVSEEMAREWALECPTPGDWLSAVQDL